MASSYAVKAMGKTAASIAKTKVPDDAYRLAVRQAAEVMVSSGLGERKFQGYCTTPYGDMTTGSSKVDGVVQYTNLARYMSYEVYHD